MKIFLIGTHSTGKTTLISEMKKRGYQIVNESIRECLRNDSTLQINENGNENSQNVFFDATYKSIENITADSFVSDRCPIDVLAYTKYLYHNKQVSEQFYKKQLQRTRDFVESCNDDIKFMFIPIEFPVENDGLRSCSEKYRSDIQKEILVILKMLKVNYQELRGSVQERINTLENIIRK